MIYEFNDQTQSMLHSLFSVSRLVKVMMIVGA
jgi:hypothetical protein